MNRPRYLCFVDDKGFMVVSSEHGTISYTMILNEASESTFIDWKVLHSKNRMIGCKLLSKLT